MSDRVFPRSADRHGGTGATLLQRLLTSTLVGVAAIDSAGLVREANDRFLRTVGYARTELAAGRIVWGQLTAGAYAALLDGAVRPEGRTATQGARELSLRSREGNSVPALVELLPLDPRGGAGLSHLAMVFDLSEAARAHADQERLAERTRAAETEARDANRAKDQFLAVLSHELRNPLAPITTAAQVLRRLAPDDERIQQVIGVIDRNARLQARLVGDLLDLSRITRGKLQLQRAPVALDRLLAQLLPASEGAAQRAGLTLTARLDQEVWIFGDAARVEQVVESLLSNALKFTAPGGRIELGLRREGDRARITVEDTGIGMDASQIERMFAMFQQGTIAGARSPGLGVGLTVVKSLVDMHDGRVWAESAGPGRGSRFTVELPLIARPGESRARAAEEAANAGRVLLVEDNDDTRGMFTELLGNLGYRTEAFASGEEGLAGLQRFHPDIILADIGLPGIDGYEFLRRARATPQGRGVPAFAITAYGQAKDVRAAREAGFDGHFVKPVDLATLHVRMREAIAERRAAQPAMAGELDGAPAL